MTPEPFMRTPFEHVYLLCAPMLPALNRDVRRELVREVKRVPGRASVLDVGGRKSPYTIGLPADVTISDLPRVSALQTHLNLGIDDAIAAEARSRRSNVTAVVLDDMTRTALPAGTFDIVVSVEVLEHVEQDARFVENVRRVLKPGGVFIMTTPNGDAVINTNPDHKRHYRRDELAALLRRSFQDVSVRYAVPDSRFRRWGLKSWSPRRPAQTALSMIGNLVNNREASSAAVAIMRDRTRHLVAVARTGQS